MDLSNEAPSTEVMVVPDTGELIPLDAPSEDLAAAVYRMKTLEDELYRVRGIVNQELTRRMDLDNKRSVEVDGFKLEVAAPGKEWDYELLDEVLADLVDAGKLSEEGKRSLYKVPEPKRSLQVRELNKLLASLPDDLAAQVRACAGESKRTRAVKVKDLEGGRAWNGE